MKDCQRLPNAIRDISPCAGCTEKFTACYDCCPKDERGEHGYKAWKAEIKRVKEEKQKYLNRQNVRIKKYSGGNYGQE